MAMAPRTATLRLNGPLNVGLTFGPHRHGPLDPSVRIEPDGLWRATRTPDGPATVRLDVAGTVVDARVWGAGAGWIIDRLEVFVGAHDVSTLVPHDPVVHDLVRRLPGLRIGASHAVIEALVPAILEQKVTSHEAHKATTRLVSALGEPAPGPIELRVPPAPDVLAAQPYWVFHRFGIERNRADVIRAVCARASRVEECVDLTPEESFRRLTHFTGVGAWTAAEVAARAFGDPDAVSVGDFHLPHVVAWALAGEPRADDSRMLELLEPYRGQRGRVIRLIEAGTARRPRRAPRQRIRSIDAI
jgi:3-methyladenine DNA glycosylase/8-oxoguanine DNA glycosylase